MSITFGWFLSQEEEVIGCPYVLLSLDIRDVVPRPSGNEDVITPILLPIDRDSSVVYEGCIAYDIINMFVLEVIKVALVDGVNVLLAVLCKCAPVKFTRCCDTITSCMLQIIQQASCIPHNLLGDTSHIDTSTTDITRLSFHHEDSLFVNSSRTGDSGCRSVKKDHSEDIS